MNNGFFGFPTSLNVKFVETVTFDSSGVYKIPKNVNVLWIYAIAGGAGGSSGARGAVSASASGGGGGGGGGHAIFPFFVDSFRGYPGTEPNFDANSAYSDDNLVITIGAGGDGGTAGGTDGSGCVTGSIGGETIISFMSPNISTQLVRLPGGALASASGGTAGGAQQIPLLAGMVLTAAGGRGGTGAVGKPGAVTITAAYGSTTVGWNGGAGGGGYNSSSALASAGGDVSLLSSTSTSFASFGPPNIARGGIVCAGGAAANNGANAPFTNISGRLTPGYGGAGGGGSSIGAAGRGGNGYRGGGGGGGGGSVAGSAAGNGGRGGNGYVCIVALE